jgi:hypothetical protein
MLQRTMMTLTPANASQEAEKFLRSIPPYPSSYRGRGIVICAGGIRLFANAWVCIRMLRHVGCQLPIELWYLGSHELDEGRRKMVAPFGATCVDASEIRKRFPARILNGWELKPYAILYSAFEEVLLLDSDNVAVRNPTFLFESLQYSETGAIFWPDFGRLAENREIWSICGVPYRDEPEFETGQIVVNKKRCWAALNLTKHYNDYSDFYYHYIHGDKESFHLAFRKLNAPYSMPAHPIEPLRGTMCQHDFDGDRLFQHRNLDKWDLFNKNQPIEGFWMEAECMKYLEELRVYWTAVVMPSFRFGLDRCSADVTKMARVLTNVAYLYVRVGSDCRTMKFLPDGTIGEGRARCEMFWNLEENCGTMNLMISSGEFVTCCLRLSGTIWEGKWLVFEQMPVQLIPIVKSKHEKPTNPVPSGPSPIGGWNSI